MSDAHDATQAFLDSLPEIDANQRFQFACHPDVPCFNACCGDLTLMLTPYDVLRLRQRLQLSSRDFLMGHVEMGAARDTGFPLARLKMREELPGAPCPFVTADGCSVYPDRPGACRTYPIGRATKLSAEGQVVEQYFLVREGHCRGFEQPGEWSPAAWATDQGLARYHEMNDRLMRLLAQQRASGRVLSSQRATMAALALYQLENFRLFLEQTGMLERLDLTPQRRAEILAHDEATLEFALDWLELTLFGHNATLRPKA